MMFFNIGEYVKYRGKNALIYPFFDRSNNVYFDRSCHFYFRSLTFYLTLSFNWSSFIERTNETSFVQNPIVVQNSLWTERWPSLNLWIKGELKPWSIKSEGFVHSLRLTDRCVQKWLVPFKFDRSFDRRSCERSTIIILELL